MSENSVSPLRHSLWLSASIFLSYLAVAMSLPVISIFVTADLRFSNAAGGLAVGVAFVATILTRGFAGRRADGKGGKKTACRGLLLYALASLVCLLPAASFLPHGAAFAVLIAGRLLLGVGESLTLVGIMTLGLEAAGPGRAGLFLSILGAGMYGSFALGGPLGIGLYDAGGFAAVAGACAAAPLLGLVMLAAVPADKPVPGATRESLWSVLGRVWKHGLIVGLQGVGFATIGAFFALMFKNRGWPNAGSGLACFAIGFVAMRVAGPALLNLLGGKGLVFLSLLVECAGQGLLWLTRDPASAVLGAFLTGGGCSMIYPAMGADIVHKVPQHLRGTAMGAFSAFQDLAYALTGPIAGLAVDHFGDHIAFLLGTASAVTGLVFLTGLRMERRPSAG